MAALINEARLPGYSFSLPSKGVAIYSTKHTCAISVLCMYVAPCLVHYHHRLRVGTTKFFLVRVLGQRPQVFSLFFFCLSLFIIKR